MWPQPLQFAYLNIVGNEASANSLIICETVIYRRQCYNTGMRITGGKARGFTIKVPKITDIRPAQEMVRLAVYSILGERIDGARVLDLYAGSGAFGLDALSRGASHCTFVDSNPLAIQAIESNLRNAHFWGKAETVKFDAIRYFSEDHEEYDIIFICPPYSYGLPSALFYQAAEHLSPDGIVIIDHAKSTIIKPEMEGLEIVDQRSYGATGVTFMQHKSTSTTQEQAWSLTFEPMMPYTAPCSMIFYLISLCFLISVGYDSY